MSKGLEAFKRLLNSNILLLLSRAQGKKQFANDVIVVKKELKTLEIIKTKYINLDRLIPIMKKWTTVDTYNELPHIWSKLTQDEYDLLKEVGL